MALNKSPLKLHYETQKSLPEYEVWYVESLVGCVNPHCLPHIINAK